MATISELPVDFKNQTSWVSNLGLLSGATLMIIIIVVVVVVVVVVTSFVHVEFCIISLATQQPCVLEEATEVRARKIKLKAHDQ